MAASIEEKNRGWSGSSPQPGNEPTNGQVLNAVFHLQKSLDQANEELELLKEELAEMKGVRSRKPSAGTMIIGRQAARAGMTVDQWHDHCLKTGHNPTKMDKSIENHSRGSLSKKASPQRKKMLKAKKK